MDLPFPDDFQIPKHRSLRAIAAAHLLEPHELKQLNDSVERVFELMRDLLWHPAWEVRLVAGTPVMPASEGLRRMRCLRPLFDIELNRCSPDARLWEYRIVGFSKTLSS